MADGRLIVKNDAGIPKIADTREKGANYCPSLIPRAPEVCADRGRGREGDLAQKRRGFHKWPHFTWCTILAQLQFSRTLLVTILPTLHLRAHIYYFTNFTIFAQLHFTDSYLFSILRTLTLFRAYRFPLRHSYRRFAIAGWLLIPPFAQFIILPRSRPPPIATGFTIYQLYYFRAPTGFAIFRPC